MREILWLYQQNFGGSPNRMANPGEALLDLIKYNLSEIFLLSSILADGIKPVDAQWINVLLFKPFNDVLGALFS